MARALGFSFGVATVRIGSNAAILSVVGVGRMERPSPTFVFIPGCDLLGRGCTSAWLCVKWFDPYLLKI